MKKLFASVVLCCLIVNIGSACYVSVLVSCGHNHTYPGHKDPTGGGGSDNMSCTRSGGGNYVVAIGAESGKSDSTWYAAWCNVTTTCEDWQGGEHHYDDSYSPTGTVASGDDC